MVFIEKKLDKGDIAAVKLLSGEELVGKVEQVPSDAGVLELSKPVALGMQQQQNPDTGQIEVGLGFAPFMLGLPEESKVVVEKGTYVTVAKAREEVRNAYIKSTTGLDLPQTNVKL